MNKISVCFVFALLWINVFAETCVTPLGATSNCVTVYNCSEILAAINQLPLQSNVITFLRQSQCGFEGKVPKVCCGPLPPKQIQPQTLQDLKPTSPPAIVQVETDPVSNEDSSPETNQCGIDNNGDKIFNGEKVNLDEFPWMVLEGYRNSNGLLRYLCGGALVNSRYVLTAAHCITGAIEDQGTLYSVRLGEHNVKTDVDCIDNVCADPPQEIRVQSAYPHPGYNGENKNREDDIGLIRLAKRAKYTYYVQPICLANNNERLIVGNHVYVAGWGKTLSGFNSPVKLKTVMPIFDKNECITKFKPLGAELTDKQICAGGIFAGGTCKGDSGGPLMMMRSSGVWEAVAVVSFGFGCGRDGWPGVYTTVASYLDWIQSTMRSTNV